MNSGQIDVGGSMGDTLTMRWTEHERATCVSSGAGRVGRAVLRTFPSDEPTNRGARRGVEKKRGQRPEALTRPS
jgi:hypothetical protein